jgi:AraC-like DNA-binding protein
MHFLVWVRTRHLHMRHALERSGWAHATPVCTIDCVESTLRRERVDVLFLELDDVMDVSAHEAFVRRTRRCYASLPIVLYTPLTCVAATQIVRLAKAGADDVVLVGEGEARYALERLIKRAQFARFVARSISTVADSFPAATGAILAHAIHRADKALSVTQLALAVGVDRRTLVNRLRAAGLPGPETVISWCRLLLAAHLLEDSGRSVERIALLLGFGSGVALRNMFRRHLGIAPSALRDEGGFECAARRLFAPTESHQPFRSLHLRFAHAAHDNLAHR